MPTPEEIAAYFTHVLGKCIAELEADALAAELNYTRYIQEHGRADDWCRKAQARRRELRLQHTGMLHRNAVIRKLEGRIEWFTRELAHRDQAVEAHMGWITNALYWKPDVERLRKPTLEVDAEPELQRLREYVSCSGLTQTGKDIGYALASISHADQELKRLRSLRLADAEAVAEAVYQVAVHAGSFADATARQNAALAAARACWEERMAAPKCALAHNHAEYLRLGCKFCRECGEKLEVPNVD